MDRTGELKKLHELVDMLAQHSEHILMDNQTKYCEPCGGFKTSMVYRSPIAFQIGVLLDECRKIVASQRAG